MKIPKRQINSWKLKWKHGDATKIHKKYGLCRLTVIRAFNLGRATEDSVSKIQKYYDKK